METIKKLFNINYDKVDWSITIDINIFFVLALLVLVIIIWFTINERKKKLVPKLIKQKVRFKIKTPNFDLEEELSVSYESIYIAHRIYIELITRKAAILIDEKYDTISEIYDSWYELFKQIRMEIKDLSGELLANDESCSNLIHITTKILNEGLRPHLTKYQASYRKWYTEMLEIDKSKSFGDRKSPQQIQQEYFDYNNLMEDLKNVNLILLKFSEQLKNLIKTNTND
jgi:hypothetical protein